MLSVAIMDAAGALEWDAYVDRHPDASAYHRWAWGEVIRRAFGHSTPYLAARRGGALCGVLPLCVIDSRLFGHYAVSLPFFNYGGVLADDPEAEAALLDHAVALARREGASHLELRMTRPVAGWPDKTGKVGLYLALPDDPDALWNGFKPKLRSQIRRPEKAGMTTRVGGAGLLDDFYRVFSRNMRDLGTPVYARKLFATILEQVPESRIAVVDHGGRAVGAGFLVGYRGRLEIPWASTIRDFNHLSPNMLLYWTVLKWACENGYREFDFGRSTEGQGTYRFKCQWGALPRPFHWCYWLADGGDLPEINPDNPRYRLPILVWKRLPLCVAERIGPAIVRNLP
ncbi:MAG: FemAB family PEP-CTERM system-associated protein [Nitrospirae bacterium]|nr:FemAB family PEP-CTERM system-associated protein [Nitrospirota bacterium]